MFCYSYPFQATQRHPNDMDIFAFSATDLVAVEDLYSEMALDPVHMLIVKSSWEASFSSQERDTSSPIDGGIDGVAPLQPFRVMERSQILPLVLSWAENYEASLRSFLSRHTGNDYETDPHGVLHTLHR